MNILQDFDLFIFDLDDTIVMTEKIHNLAWNTILNQNKSKPIYLNFYDYCKYFHTTQQEGIAEYLKNEHNIFDIVNIFNQKMNIYLDLITNNKPDLNKSVDIFINKIIENNKKFVIVTNGSKILLDKTIEFYPILNKSSKLYYKEIFKYKKPNPECYLKILNDFPYEKKIGFEDSVTGIIALTHVPEITPVFVNNKDYYHYDYIMNNFNVINIKDFSEIV